MVRPPRVAETNSPASAHPFFRIGCGKFFEGTAEEMHKALNVTLASLPNDTRVFVSYGHAARQVDVLC